MNAACALVLGLLVSAASCSHVPIAASPAPLPGHTVDISVGEYFIIAPDSISAGVVSLRLTQTGDVVKAWAADTAKLRADLSYHFHMVWVVRLDSAKTYSDLFAAERDRLPSPWASILGGPGFADHPGTSNVTMVLTPGHYALVCYVGSAREDRNRYHLLKGMIRPLTVTEDARSRSLPAAQIQVVLRGDTVQMPDTLAAGEWRIAARNEDKRSADLGVVKVKVGYSVDQARAWSPRLMTDPPRVGVGGVVFIRPEQSLITTIRLTPGDFLFNGKHVVVR